AHLLFDGAPPALLEKVELVVRLVRSKGVGVYFVTQNPIDIPDKVLGQLGNRVQHALRAFTPRDQKAVKAVAQTMRPNPQFDIERVILELGVGEALISLLDGKGTPGVTQRAYVLPPASRIGPITPEERKALMADSMVAGVYEKTVDRESAFERLKARTQAPQAVGVPAEARAGAGAGTAGSAEPAPAGGSRWGGLGDILFGSTGPRGGRREGMVDAMAKSAARTVGSAVAREIARGVLGSLLGGRRR
ncbi:MAG TPA: helicase HerA-like domain-containing protein, partial [Burkholderiaceae bacterium]|nr:helicase HerA-like domain-containing protein [Burkholderiaceae bacterium]